MVKEIRVPTLGESVIEATVSQWLKQEGEQVAVDDPLLELETDKVNLEIPSEYAGILVSVTRTVGETVKIGDVLGIIDMGGQGTENREQKTGNGGETLSPSVIEGVGSKRDEDDQGKEPHATPVALRMATENRIDIRSVAGSGPGGRVTKSDLVSRMHQAGSSEPEQKPAQGHPLPVSSLPFPSTFPTMQQPTEDDREERVRMSRRRQTIARRLVEAQQTAAMLTTFNEIDMSAVMELRMRWKEPFFERHHVGLGFMSFFVKAVVGALKQFPLLNAEIQGDEFVIKHYYDIGIAVGTDQGLVVPVLRQADRKTFAQIEQDVAGLASRARSNTLSLEDLQGGTFSITNGGVYGSLMSTPILNTPQVGILGMHKIERRAVVVGEAIVIRPMMYVALSYDHRIVDGSEAVRCLVRIKELVECPEALLLEG